MTSIDDRIQQRKAEALRKGLIEKTRLVSVELGVVPTERHEIIELPGCGISTEQLVGGCTYKDGHAYYQRVHRSSNVLIATAFYSFKSDGTAGGSYGSSGFGGTNPGHSSHDLKYGLIQIGGTIVLRYRTPAKLLYEKGWQIIGYIPGRWENYLESLYQQASAKIREREAAFKQRERERKARSKENKRGVRNRITRIDVAAERKKNWGF